MPAGGYLTPLRDPVAAEVTRQLGVMLADLRRELAPLTDPDSPTRYEYQVYGLHGDGRYTPCSAAAAIDAHRRGVAVRRRLVTDWKDGVE